MMRIRIFERPAFTGLGALLLACATFGCGGSTVADPPVDPATVARTPPPGTTPEMMMKLNLNRR